jgi:hypothetical protein
LKDQANKRGSRHGGNETFGGYECLQRLWLDYPGDEDVYESISFDGSCQNPDEELWTGGPQTDNDMPQDCDLCEPGIRQTTQDGELPPHQMNVNDKKAWDRLKSGLEGAKISTSELKYECHTITDATAQQFHVSQGRDLNFIDVELPGVVSPLGTRFLCFEVAGFLPQAPIANIDSVGDMQLRPGSQLWIKYTVGGKQRTGFLWLKQ